MPTRAIREASADAVIRAPFGRVGIRIRDGFLENLYLLDDEVPLRAPRNGLAREVAAQLQAYFEQPDVRFSLPLNPAGTCFQQRVWQALRGIPSGAVRSYGALAQSLGTGARAVGGACRANPLPIIVPCHRVIAAEGIGGFSGRTAGAELARKRWLLMHEGARLPQPGGS